MNSCPICKETLINCIPPGKAAGFEVDCPRCGSFITDFSADTTSSYLTNHARAVISHRLRRAQMSSGQRPEVYSFELSNWKLDQRLPSPADQANSLIEWIGDHQSSPSEFAVVPASALSAWVGAAVTPEDPNKGILWLLDQPEVKAKLNQGPYRDRQWLLQLTMAGWERYQDIKHAKVESRTAFMAMKFGDAELDRVVESYFKPAVKRADFELYLLTDKQRAGLIDDQLRVRLRASRFVIADLTHANNGAYWEAGFAEGLGRPVIYTCRKKEWIEQKSHFDTNHLVTIVWDPEDLDGAAKHLTATVRATLPGEAKMQD